MFTWIYDLTNLQLALLLCSICLAYTWLGVVFVGNLVRRKCEDPSGIAEFVGQYLAAFGLFFGLMLGLIAVATYENYGKAEDAVGVEANRAAMLFRTVSSYPEPYRQGLQQALAEYVDYTVDETWPAYRRGLVPPGRTERLNLLQARLFTFQPMRPSEQVIHAEALRQFADFVEATRDRVAAVDTALPPLLWIIVVIGAAMTMALLWFITHELLWVRLTASGILAVFVGLMMFFIAAMDHPLRGDYSISPDALIELRETMRAATGG
jgi:hypothetical protein